MAETTGETSQKTVVAEAAEESDSESDVERPQRERKKIEHYVAQQTTVERKPKEIKPGQGTKLADIPNVNKLLSTYKQTDQEMKTIHKLCFTTVGSEKTRKRSLKEFSGSSVCFCRRIIVCTLGLARFFCVRLHIQR